MSRVFMILFLVTVSVLVSSFFFRNPKPLKQGSNIVVISSIYPLFEFSREVGGKYVTPLLITPSGIEPHEYEPSPIDIIKIAQSDLFLYVSPYLESWAPRITSSLPKGKPIILEAAANTTLEKNDPHIWIDPVKAIEIVQAIKNSLTSLDPDHKDAFEENANAYIEKLKSLDRGYSALAGCISRDIITMHDAFYYLSHRYGFTVHPLLGLSTEGEPSAQKISEITSLVKEKRIRYIFYEALSSREIVKTVSRESGARTLQFNPIEGLTAEDMKINKTYIDIQNDNINNLKLAFVCQ